MLSETSYINTFKKHTTKRFLTNFYFYLIPNRYFLRKHSQTSAEATLALRSGGKATQGACVTRSPYLIRKLIVIELIMFYVSGSRRCSCCGRSTQRDEKAVLLQFDDRVLTAASKSSRSKINSRPTTLLNYYQREPERIEVNLVPRNVFSRIKTAAARKKHINLLEQVYPKMLFFKTVC